MDENKIEISVELETKEAEKQADKLNDKLVDGAKDASKEFDKMKNNVNKNLSNIQKQVEKTFDGAKMANKMSSGISKALDTIKGKINNILGNINVKANLDANVSSNNKSGSNGGSNVATSLATGGAIGAMLNKTQAITDKLKNTKGLIENISNLTKKIKFGQNGLGVDTLASGIYEFKENFNDAYGTSISFSKALDLIVGSLKSGRNELNMATVTVDSLEYSVNQMKNAIEKMFFGGQSFGLLNESDMAEYKEILKVIATVENKIRDFKALIASGRASQDTPISPKVFADLKGLYNELIPTMTGLNKFRLVAHDAFTDIREKASDASIKTEEAFSKLIPKNIFARMTQLSNAFKQGFKNPQTYINGMKAKIQEWANKHKQATDKVKNANKTVGSSFKNLLKQVLPFASLYGIFNGLKNSITSFIDMGETVSKFNTVFGSMSNEATKWADNLASSVAVSKSELMDASSNLMGIAKASGMATDEAYKFSTSMSELAIDLDSFYNTTDALSAVRSGISGEYDSLKRYGILLNENMVQAKMLSMGLNEASNSSKMLARQALITEQMMASGAFNDAIRTSGSLSNQLKMLRYNFQALGQSIGACFSGLLQVVIPVLNKIVASATVMFNKLAQIINSIFGLFGIKVGGGSSSGGGIGGAIGGAIDGIGDAVGGMSDALGSGASGAEDVADALKGGAESAKQIMGLMNIDEINALSSDKGSGDSGSGSGNGGSGSGNGGGGGGALDGVGAEIGGLETSSNQLFEAMSRELSKFEKAFLMIFQKIKTGFMAFKDEIVNEWTKLKLNIEKLGQAMVDFFVACWENGLDKTFIMIGGIIGAITKTALQVSNKVVEVVTNLFNHLNPNNNENTKKFIDALNEMLKQVAKFIDDCGDWFAKFADKAQPFINNLGDIAMIVGTILSQALADAIKLVRDFMNSWIGEAIITGVCKALEWFSGLIEDCLSFIRDHLDVFEALALGITGAYGAFKLINGAISIWNGLAFVFSNIGAICGGVATLLSGAIGFLASPIGIAVVAIGGLIAIGVLLYKNWDTVKAKCAELWKGLQTYWNYITTLISNKCKEIWTTVQNIFNKVKDKVIGVVSSIWNTFKEKFPNLANIVKTYVTNIYNIFNNYFNIIKTVVKTVLEVIKALFTGDFGKIKTIVKDALEIIKNNISNIWSSIKALLKNYLDAIKLTFTTIWNGIKSVITTVLNSIKTTVSNIWNAIKTTISNVVNSIKTTVTNWINNAKTTISNGFNNVKTTINNIWNGIKSVINTVIGYIKNAITNWINNSKTNITNGFNSVKNFILTVWNAIKTVFTTITNAIKNIITTWLNNVKNNFTNIFNAIKSFISTVFNAIKNTINTVMNAIKTVISNIINNVKTVFSNGFNNVKTTVVNIFNSIKSSITNVMNAVKNTINNIINGVKSVFSNGFNSVRSTVSSIFNGISSTIINVMNNIRNTINNIINAIKTVFSNGFNSAKTTVTNIFNSIKNSIQNIMNGVKNTINSVINGIKSVFSSGFNSAKTTAVNIFNSIKSGISNAINGAKNTVSSVVNGISNSLKNGFNGAKNTVVNVFNSMKNSINNIMNSAKTIVSNAVSRIKGFFNFSWSLPRPKIPSFTPKWSTVFGVKVPTGFTINWHAKGGIFTQPTILGNHGFGEKGAEAVLPLSEFYNKEDERFNRLAKQLASNNNNGTTTVIVQLDGKEVARSTVKQFKQMSQLGTLDTSWL